MSKSADEPVATALDEIVHASILAAVFHPGKATALGHHWTLHDGGGRCLATTHRVHNGGRLARAGWNLVTLTGMDTGNDIHVELHGAGGNCLARLDSVHAKPSRVNLHDPSGLSLGGLRHEGETLVLEGPDPATTVATLTCDETSTWPVMDGSGAALGELVLGAPGPDTAPSWWEIIDALPTPSADFARTMHLGVRRVTRYTFARNADVRTLPASAALLPLLAGLVY